MTYNITILAQTLGGHTHLSFWTAPKGTQPSRAGDSICFRNEEWVAMANRLGLTAEPLVHGKKCRHEVFLPGPGECRVVSAKEAAAGA